MSAIASNKTSLKLLVDKIGQRVLLAEAGKDFVVFLFFLLSLPIGTVISLLTKHAMVGCIGNLYTCVENLSETCIQPNQNKDFLLKPKAVLAGAADKDVPFHLSEENESVQVQKELYICPGEDDCINVINDPRTVCPECRKRMNVEVPYMEYSTGGFVKGVVTYMIMDDLVVEPMSAISDITLLNKFNIQDVGVLEERMVGVTMIEGLKLLQTSCKKVLTTVFTSDEHRTLI